MFVLHRDSLPKLPRYWVGNTSVQLKFDGSQWKFWAYGAGDGWLERRGLKDACFDRRSEAARCIAAAANLEPIPDVKLPALRPLGPGQWVAPGGYTITGRSGRWTVLGHGLAAACRTLPLAQRCIAAHEPAKAFTRPGPRPV